MSSPPSQAVRRAVAASLAVTLSALGAVVLSPSAPASASAAPATMASSEQAASTGPLEAREPNVLFSDGFEHDMDTTPKMIDQYTSATGERYDADAFWKSAAACNGIITSKTSANLGACNVNGYLRTLAGVLGEVTGQDPDTNHAVSAYTQGDPVKGSKVQLRTVQPIAVDAKGRYLSFGVAAAAMSCSAGAPLLKFSLVDGANTYPTADQPINVCTDPSSQQFADGVKAGKFVSKGGLLFTGEDVGILLENEYESGLGNDGAFDDVTIVDSTPTLGYSFAAGEHIVGDTVPFTMTVVNTTEHGQKLGWSFEQRLPSGIDLASDPNLRTTCADGDVALDGRTVTASGDLKTGEASCTVTLDVTATKAATTTFAPDSMTASNGVLAPAAADVTFVPEANALTATEAGRVLGGNGDDVADLGEEVVFDTTVQNEGNVLVRNLTVSGSHGDVTCADTTLAPGASTTCSTEPESVTQDDIDAGGIADAVSTAATSRLGAAVAAPMAQAFIPTTVADARIGLELSTTATAPEVGDRIDVTARMSNIGNVSMSAAEVIATAPVGVNFECASRTVAPGASIDCTARGYTVTQADVDRGAIGFTATGTMRSGAGATVPTDRQTLTVPTVAAAPSISVAASNDAGKVPAVGVVVTVRAAVENTGNTTITDLAATLTGRDGLVGTCPAATLAPGASTACVFTGYVVTQQDIDGGSVRFAATVTGTDARGTAVTKGDDTSVTIPADGRVDVASTIAIGGDSARPVTGDTVNMRFVVSNPGSVTLTGIRTTVVDHDGIQVTCPTDNLAPGQQVTCTATTTLSQADVDAGSITYEAAVTATTPAGEPVRASDPATAPIAATPAATLAVSASAGAGDVPAVGDEVVVTAVVENIGNVTITAPTFTVAGHPGLTATCPTDTIAPGATVTCELRGEQLTQQNIDAGRVGYDVALAATGPKDAEVTATDSDAIVIPAAPAATLTMHAELPGDVERPMAGDSVDVTVTAANTGTVTLTDTTVALTGIDGKVTCADATLAPGASTECTAKGVTLTQADIDGGHLTIDAHLTATAPSGAGTTTDASATIELAAASGAEVQVEAIFDGPREQLGVGDTIDARVTVTNTGNSTITDPTAGIEGVEGTTVCDADTIAPGDSVECIVTGRTITQDDVETGAVSYLITATATDPHGTVVSADGTVRVEVAANPSLTVRVEPKLLADGRDVVRPGDRIEATVTVTNTGNLQVDRPGATMAPAGDLTCSSDAPLLPGGSVRCDLAEPYVVTEADAAAGKVRFVTKAGGWVIRAGAPELVGPSAKAMPSIERTIHIQSKAFTTDIRAEATPLELAFTGAEGLVPATIIAALAIIVGLSAIAVRRATRRGTGRHAGGHTTD